MARWRSAALRRSRFTNVGTSATAEFLIGAKGQYTLETGVNLLNNSFNTATITNTGIFAKAGAGTSIVAPNFTNTGKIEVLSGTPNLTGTLVNDKQVTVEAGSLVVAARPWRTPAGSARLRSGPAPTRTSSRPSPRRRMPSSPAPPAR